jgi:hypothetical protein
MTQIARARTKTSNAFGVNVHQETISIAAMNAMEGQVMELSKSKQQRLCSSSTTARDSAWRA